MFTAEEARKLKYSVYDWIYDKISIEARRNGKKYNYITFGNIYNSTEFVEELIQNGFKVEFLEKEFDNLYKISW